MKFNTDEVNQLLKGRRSVFPKDYTGEKVEDSVIHQLLENANWAPTHKLTEPWRFVVFANEAVKQFNKDHAELYKQFTPADKFLSAW